MSSTFFDRTAADASAVTAPDTELRHVVEIASIGVLAVAAVTVGLVFHVTFLAALGGLGLVAATVVQSNRWMSDED